MDHKKGQAFAIVMIILFVIVLIAGIITTVMIFNKDKIFKKDINESVIELFISSIGTESNYVLFQDNQIPLQGKLKKDTYIPIGLSNASEVSLSCWTDNYYTSSVNKEFTFREKELNKSKIECTPKPIGNLEIDLIKSNLQNDEGTITFELSSEQTFQNLGICVAWTVGFIEVFKEESAINCDGVWRNYTSFNAETDIFEFLPEGQFICKDVIKECERIDGSLCYPKQFDIPSRLRQTNDECFYYGKTINNDPERIVVGFRSIPNKNQLDNIIFTFIDYDYRYNPTSKQMELLSEVNGIDIGARDIKYQVRYDGGHGSI